MLHQDFTHDYDRVIKRLKDCSEAFKRTRDRNRGVASEETVAPTDSARLRLITGFFQLTGNSIKSWKDFVAVWRGYQRAVLEIYAFSAWWAAVSNDWFEPYLSHCERRGFILCDASEKSMSIFERYTKRLRLPVYIVLDRRAWEIPRDNRERLPLCSRCSTDAWFSSAGMFFFKYSRGFLTHTLRKNHAKRSCAVFLSFRRRVMGEF
jgi:hypothetical protein